MTEQIEAELRRHLELWADVAVPGPDLASLEREGRTRAARRRGWATAVAAAVAVIVTIASVSWALRDGVEVVPAPPADTPSSGPDQSPPPSTSADPTRGPTQVVSPDTVAPTDGRSRWVDGRDTEDGAIDLREVRSSIMAGRPYWRLELRGAYPTLGTPGAPRVIEYGLVLDLDGDLAADCRIGISDDTRDPDSFRVWVENLRTGVSDDRTGPPYGIPVDFAHPAEEYGTTTMTFFFVTPDLGACGQRGPTSTFYAWSSASNQEGGVAQDIAPDDAWLAMSP